MVSNNDLYMQVIKKDIYYVVDYCSQQCKYTTTKKVFDFVKITDLLYDAEDHYNDVSKF